ncbi:uncharacterized protein LOC103702623 isoform X2 [Phoenix dactylifera]|uniref:Uncharacterized protein LOC103702623 isoform X2 n=1 Tax=Phoenix dactylifera TaxID=42345 RepID=A0A8B8J1L4_PHODC|nr:uncharacterized protein LOC103702623 isoform X2 [Phoenix dactylifera]
MIGISTASRCSYCPPGIKPLNVSFSTSLSLSKSWSLSIPLSTTKKRSGCELRLHRRYPWCRAAKTGPVKKRATKRRAPEKPVTDDDDGLVEAVPSPGQPSPLPKPPTGFVLDPHGRVLTASLNRLATIVNDDEVEAIIPAAAYALAKIHMHLVFSGFCYTARGSFCYSEDDILEFRTDDGEDIDGLPSEGAEITCFHLDGTQYMIYTPSDPLLFVAVKDKNGLLQIADDDLLDDPAIIGAIDEETEFNALVEEEAALLESLLRER